MGATLGSTSHFFPALIEKAAGIKFKYVSYEGLAPRMNAILGGHIDLTDSNLTQKGKVEAGQLKFIAIATEKRSPEMPNVPTLKELGVNVVYDVNRGLLAPKGTPADVLAKLESACAAAAKEPAFADAMKKQGTDVRYLDRKAVRRVAQEERRAEQDAGEGPRPAEAVSRDGIAGLAVLAASLVLFALTLGLKDNPMVPVGPGFYPRIVLALTALLSLGLVVSDALSRNDAPREQRQADAQLPAGGAQLRRLRAVRVALPWLGFRIATFALRGGANALLDPPRGARGWVARR